MIAAESYMDFIIRGLMLGLLAAVVVLLMVAFTWARLAGRRREGHGFEVKTNAVGWEENDGEGPDQHH